MGGKKEITINGEKHGIAHEATLLDVVRGLNLEPDRVAIELNRTIVRREEWMSTTFADGSEIEVVQFVGGG